MPTKLRRIAISVSLPLESMIEKEASFSQRPLSSQIVFILEKYFAEKQRELDYFRPTRLSEASKADEPQFFETPRKSEEPSVEHLQKLREKIGRDNT